METRSANVDWSRNEVHIDFQVAASSPESRTCCAIRPERSKYSVKRWMIDTVVVLVVVSSAALFQWWNWKH